MLLLWDLGISSLVLVVCLVFPVLGLLIHRQWRLASAKREEIGKLMVLASEEAARAEFEASVGYGSVSVSDSYHCAVCYCPTATRCSRCKAVRYCSGKCQVIHWRQGHRDECHSPSITYKTDDKTSNECLKVVEKYLGQNHGDKLVDENWQHAKPVATPVGESILSNSTSALEDPRGNTAYISAEFIANKEEENSVAETSGSSFSGFSSSPSNDSSDVVSLCESISSLNSERSEAPLDSDFDVEMVEATFNVNGVATLKPLSPKFTDLVESGDSLANLNKLDQSKPGGHVGESLCGPVNIHSNIIDRHDGSVAPSMIASSGFWGRTLECVEPVSDACDDSSPSVHFSLSSSEETSPDHAKVCEVKNNISDEAAMAVLENNKPTDRVTLSEVSCEGPSNSTCDSSCASVPQEAKPQPFFTSSSADPSFGSEGDSTRAGALNVNNSLHLNSKKSKNIADDCGSTSCPVKIRGVKHFTFGVSEPNIPSIAAVHPALSAKCSRIPDSKTHNASALHSTGFVTGKTGCKTSILKVVDQFRRSEENSHYKAGGGSEIGRRHADRGLFPYELFVKLYNWNKVELRPCGLTNCGNSCYANAVLQCLMFTRPLTAYFLQGFHSKSCLRKEWCFNCEFEKLVLKANEGRSFLSPIGILSHLQNLGIQLDNGREEDAHEFLRFAVDTMQTSCIREAGHDTSSVVGREETTIVGLTFGGYLKSKIKCTKCQGKSERHERMMDLTVEIEGEIGTLEEALRRFTGTEILDGENKYKCGRCKSYERAKKKLKILEAPNILTVALKRFQSGKFGKLNKSIRFPETLDLASYVSGGGNKSHVYRLYGVVVHLDILNAAFSGHYVCYVKNTQNKWYKADDSTVAATELDKVLTKGAYMLFYARCSPRPPRLLCNKTVSSDQKIGALLSKANGKNATSPSKSTSTNPSVVPDGRISIQSFYSKFYQLQRILGEDSSCNSSSLFSNSDEFSCSTDSFRDSTSNEDLADFIFGDLGLCS